MRLFILFLLCLFSSISLSKTLPIVTEPLPIAGIGSDTYRVKDTILLPVSDRSNAKIRIGCGPSLYAQIDPMVSPGVEMSAHQHTFFGNTSINPNSDLFNLIDIGNSTCNGGIAFRSVGWIPSIIDNEFHSVVRPKGNLEYYFSGYGDKVFNNIEPIPLGLNMITGDSNSISPTQTIFSKKYAFYQCISVKQVTRVISYGTMPVCVGGELLRIVLSFPNCWDGFRLDSPDHKSHVAYSKPNSTTFNDCPTTHPHRIVQISFNIDYKVPLASTTANWLLASDDTEIDCKGCSLHGDWAEGDSPHIIYMIVANLMRSPHDGYGDRLGVDPSDNKAKQLY